jgi:hypothetical protein
MAMASNAVQTLHATVVQSSLYIATANSEGSEMVRA